MKSIAVLSLIAVTAMFAVFGWIARESAEYFGVFQQIALRCAVAAMLLFVFWGENIRHKQMSLHDHAIAALRGFLSGPISTALFVIALQETTVSNVYFLVALPFSVIQGPLLFGELWSTRAGLAAILAIAGAALISTPDITEGIFTGRGELFAILSAVTGALAMAARKWHSDAVDTTAIAFYGVVQSGVQCFLASLVFESWPGVWSVRATGITLFAGVLVAACSLLLAHGYRVLDVTTAGIVMLLESVFGCLVGAWVYGEQLTLQISFGAAAIIASAVVGLVQVRWLERSWIWGNPERRRYARGGRRGAMRKTAKMAVFRGLRNATEGSCEQCRLGGCCDN